MSPAIALMPPVARPVPALRAPQLHWRVVAKILFVTVPAMAAFGTSQILAAGIWLISSLIPMLIWTGIQRDRFGMMAIALAVLPALVMVRGYAVPFNAPLLILSAVLAFVLLDGEMFRRFWGNGLTKYLFLGFTLYWLAAFMITGFYSSNLK